LPLAVPEPLTKVVRQHLEAEEIPKSVANPASVVN
jgi:hypothetical protein